MALGTLASTAIAGMAYAVGIVSVHRSTTMEGRWLGRQSPRSLGVRRPRLEVPIDERALLLGEVAVAVLP